MGDALLSADSGLCGACCVCCTASIWSYCLLKPYGTGSATSAPCGGPRGCCGSCLQSGFDDDWYEKAERKAQEKKKKREREDSEKVGDDAAGGAVGAVDHDANDAPVVATQPAPATAMQAPLADGGAKTS